VTRAKTLPRPRAVVLLSGGMDSAATLALARRRGFRIAALTVGYGQRHDRERRSARSLAAHFRVERHIELELPIGPLLRSALTRPRSRLPSGGNPAAGGIPVTYVPARNTILLSLALGIAESWKASTIFVGVNAIDYSGYPDCRPAFLRAFERLAAVATKAGVEGHRFRVEAPLLHLTKAGIVRLGERLRVPWGTTWSCYAGGRRPCGRCDACRLRAKGFAEAGVADPLISTKAAPPSGRVRSRSSRA
jgi:7-cyano-7-deazaguanine synthase